MPNLDILRLFLASEVVYIHWVAVNGHARPGWIVPPVAAFVCISGYLIPASFTSSRGWPHFAWKRLLRVGPGFLLSLAAVLCIYGVHGLGIALLCYLSAGILTTAVDGPLWSLMVEEVLYAFHAMSRRIFHPLTVAAVLAGVCVLWRFYWRAPIGMTGGIYLSTVAAFFVGNLLYFARERIGQSWKLAGLSAIALVLAYNVPAVPFGLAFLGWPSYMAAFMLKCALPLVLCIALPQLTFGKRRDGKARELVDLSYTIYVLHAPLIGLFMEHGLRELPLLAAAATVTLAVAIPFALFVERPVLSLKNRAAKLRRDRTKAETAKALETGFDNPVAYTVAHNG